MPRHLYRFGFESPPERSTNLRDGTDFESSSSLCIEAPDAEAALAWGREVSQAFVIWLFERAGEPAPDWQQEQFAHWIETDPAPWATTLQIVNMGEMPDLTAL